MIKLIGKHYSDSRIRELEKLVEAKSKPQVLIFGEDENAERTTGIIKAFIRKD